MADRALPRIEDPPVLPDPAASRAVLIGSDEYRDLTPLPAVANNLRRLGELLGSPELWGLPARNCAVLRNPASPAAVLDLIHQAAVEASDTLVVYYAGHGLVDPHTDDLYLALPESGVSRLYSAIRFDDLRREMVTVSAAASKVVILDCCYSGRAMAGGMSGSMEMADQARIEGTYLMTASADTVKAQAPIGEEYTAFTGELVNVLNRGMPDGPDFLNLETLYWHVRKALVAKRRPVPQQRAGNDGGMIVLARNRRGAQSRALATAPAAGQARGRRPEPPAGYEYLMRRSPRDIADEAARLAGTGDDALARQLLAAAGARRPDQEVASLIMALRQAGRDGDAELVTSAIRERPASEITAVVELLRQFGSEQDAVLALRSVALGTPEIVAATADVLAASGSSEGLRQLLDAAITVHRRPEQVIALVGALSSAGLVGEIGRLLDLAAEGLTEAEIAGLGDALRDAGRDEAAFRLYAAASRSVARRPSSDVASLLRAMRESGQDDDADAVMKEICAAAREPGKILELASALWSVSLDTDAGHLLSATAGTLTAPQIADLAASLREADRYDAALRLSIEAAAQHPPAATVALVTALRDAGRPADAQRVLDSSQSWPPQRTAGLISILNEAGARTDTDRALASASRSGPGPLALFMAALRDHGFREGAARLAELIPVDVPAEVGVLVSALIGQNLDTEAQRLLARAAAGPAEYHAELITSLRQTELGQGADYLIDWEAQQGVDSVAAYLTVLHQQGLSDDERQLLTRFSARPVTDIIALAERVGGNAGQTDILARSIAQRPPPDILAVLEQAQQTSALDIEPILSALADAPPQRTGPLIARLHAAMPELAAQLTQLIASRCPPSRMTTLISDMRDAGDSESADILLAAVAGRADDDALMDLHSALRGNRQFQDADYLLEIALSSRPVAFMETAIRRAGGLYALCQDRERMRSALMQIAERRSKNDIQSFRQLLSVCGYVDEARQLRKYARRS